MWVYRVPTVVSGGSSGKDWVLPKAKGIYIANVYYGADLTGLNVGGGGS